MNTSTLNEKSSEMLTNKICFDFICIIYLNQFFFYVKFCIYLINHNNEKNINNDNNKQK